MELPPLSWARSAFEWLGEKPKYQWTLGSNPLLGQRSIATLPLSRGARFVERGLMAGWAIGAYMGAPVIAGMLGLTVGAPLTLAAAGIALFNLKANAICMGLICQAAVVSGRFLTQAFDQIVHGPDEFRPQKLKKSGNQQMQAPGAPKPSVIDKMIALGQTFNGPAGKAPLGGTVIWGDPSAAPTPSTTYDGTVKVPTTDQLTVANGRREGVERIINPNKPAETHTPAPQPAPSYRPPGCD